MHQGGTALVKAAQMVIEKGRAIAAGLLQANIADVVFSAGRFKVQGTEREMDLLAVARAASDPANLPDGSMPGLDSMSSNQSDVFTFPNGCHLAEIEVDPETGVVTLERYTVVDDYGRLINPMLTKGQVQGGVAQGVGQALFEHTVYDAGSGQLLSGSLMDYALPRADDLPPFDITLAELPTSANPLGVRARARPGASPHRRPSSMQSSTRFPARHRSHRHAGGDPERIWRAIRAVRG